MNRGDPDFDGLIRDAQGGDTRAADQLWGLVRARLVGRGDRAMEASDLAQESLLYTAGHFERFRGATGPELMAWVEGIRGHLAIDARRRQAAQKRGGGRATVSLDEATSDWPLPAHSVPADDTAPPERAMRAERFAAAIGQLPEDQRQVVHLYYLEDRTLDAIAAELHLEAGAVALLLDAGVKGLRGLIRRDGEESSDGRPS